jgi:hypothetical protein
VKLLALSLLAPSAIAGSRAVQSIALAVKPNALAVAPGDYPISDMLDFVDPISAGRRRCTLNRLGGYDEPGRQLASQHCA